MPTAVVTNQAYAMGAQPAISCTQLIFFDPCTHALRTGVLSGTSGEHSIGGLRACNTAWRDSTETGGSATELSATDAWRGAAVGDAMHIRLIGTIARSNFRKRRRAGRMICTRAHARASQREKP